jgi:hypothetical protein
MPQPLRRVVKQKKPAICTAGVELDELNVCFCDVCGKPTIR